MKICYIFNKILILFNKSIKIGEVMIQELLNEDKRIKLIKEANRAITYITWGVFKSEAMALNDAATRLGKDNVKVIIDSGKLLKSNLLDKYKDGLEELHAECLIVKNKMDYFYFRVDDETRLISNIDKNEKDVLYVFRINEEDIIDEVLYDSRNIVKEKNNLLLSCVKELQKREEKYIKKYIKENIKVVSISFSGTRFGKKEINLGPIIRKIGGGIFNCLGKINVKIFADSNNSFKNISNKYENEFTKIKDRISIPYYKGVRLIAKKDICTLEENIKLVINELDLSKNSNLKKKYYKELDDFYKNCEMELKNHSINFNKEIKEEIGMRIESFEDLAKNVEYSIGVFDLSDYIIEKNFNKIMELLQNTKIDGLKNIYNNIS